MAQNGGFYRHFLNLRLRGIPAEIVSRTVRAEAVPNPPPAKPAAKST